MSELSVAALLNLDLVEDVLIHPITPTRTFKLMSFEIAHADKSSRSGPWLIDLMECVVSASQDETRGE